MNKPFSVIWDGIVYEAFLNRETVLESGLAYHVDTIQLNSEAMDIEIPITHDEYDEFYETPNFLIHRYVHDRLKEGRFNMITY
jgi:hypothetical protein